MSKEIVVTIARDVARNSRSRGHLHLFWGIPKWETRMAWGDVSIPVAAYWRGTYVNCPYIRVGEFPEIDEGEYMIGHVVFDGVVRQRYEMDKVKEQR